MYTKEQEYDAEYYTIEAASCQFIDEICGDLNVDLNDHRLIETDRDTYWEEDIIVEDGRKLSINIVYDDNKDVYDCECIEMPNKLYNKLEDR